jgi:hypothetical protein
MRVEMMWCGQQLNGVALRKVGEDERRTQGRANKDYLDATGEKQFEFIEFSKEIDLTKAEVAINLDSGTLPSGPAGTLRVWFGRAGIRGAVQA